jgi:hypothetical protein
MVLIKKQPDVSWALWGHSADVEGDVGTLVDSMGTDMDYDENPDHNIIFSVSRAPSSSTNTDATVHGMRPVNVISATDDTSGQETSAEPDVSRPHHDETLLPTSHSAGSAQEFLSGQQPVKLAQVSRKGSGPKKRS